MPDRCCVPNCQSNYDSSGTYVSVFKIPKCEKQRQLWLRKIPRKKINSDGSKWEPSVRTVVCAKHFREEDIIRFDELPVKDGTVIKIPRKHPRLKNDAYPSIFENCPNYLTEEKPPERISRDEKLKRIDDLSIRQFLDSEKIKNYSDLCEKLDIKLSSFNVISKPYTIKNSENVYLLNLNLLPVPSVTSSLKVNNDMSLNIFISDKPVSILKFKSLFNDTNCKLSCWSELENLLVYIKNLEANENSIELSDHKEKAIYHWKNYISYNDEELYDIKKFILEQMELCEKSKMARRYSREMIIFAYRLYMKSSACYSELHESELVVLPSASHLSKMTSILDLDNSLNSAGTKKYIMQKFNQIKTEDKTVNLLLDEIYVKKGIIYKGRSLSGFAENKPNCEASTILAFMISSIFSEYKETVALVPVNNLNAEYLSNLACKALKLLDEAGFDVISMITDNNRINRNMFEKLGYCQDSSCILNPTNNEKHLFILFDSVHLLKSIRNNWINQLDSEKTFSCPDFQDFEKIISPKFSNLRKLFDIEKDSIVKTAPMLSFKTVYPSNLEKQNVKLAVNAFHESNEAALESLGEEHSLPNWRDTRQFLQVIRRWWNIMNVSHLKKGLYLNCDDSQPFSSVDDNHYIFLERFLLWLNKWKSLQQKQRCGCLSEETFFALTATTRAIIDVTKKLLMSGHKFVLTSKFQTDKLENRFSRYRQMSGSNYHVCVQQILESERKLKLKSILELHSNMCGTIPLKSFVMEFSTNDMETEEIIDLIPFADIINGPMDLSTISKTDARVLTYIAGYCVSNLKTNCSTCLMFCVTKRELLVETCEGNLAATHYAYIEIVNRGGLKYPTEAIISIVSTAYLIFQKLLTKDYEEIFIHNISKQHKILMKIIEQHLIVNNIFYVNDLCPNCNCQFLIMILHVIKTFANICLNNYVKVFNSNFVERSEQRKTKKFKK